MHSVILSNTVVMFYASFQIYKCTYPPTKKNKSRQKLGVIDCLQVGEIMKVYGCDDIEILKCGYDQILLGSVPELVLACTVVYLLFSFSLCDLLPMLEASLILSVLATLSSPSKCKNN